MAKPRKRLVRCDAIHVAVKTPAMQLPVSRGFYQVEEDRLYIPLYPGGKFFSFLDSSQLTFDVDHCGRLLFIQVYVARHEWSIRNDIAPPAPLDQSDIRFLGFRDALPEAGLETAPDQSWLHIVFDRAQDSTAHCPADNLIFEITPEKTLASIWITAIEDDRAARAMAAWRKKIKETFKEHDARRGYVRIEINR